MPYVYTNTQSKHDHTLGQTTAHSSILPDIEAIGRSINHSKPFSDRHDDDAATAAAGDGGAIADAKPTISYSNSNLRSNSNSIFIPASTSKYPIKQNTIAGDFHERFINLVAHWIRVFVYLARK